MIETTNEADKRKAFLFNSESGLLKEDTKAFFKIAAKHNPLSEFWTS